MLWWKNPANTINKEATLVEYNNVNGIDKACDTISQWLIDPIASIIKLLAIIILAKCLIIGLLNWFFFPKRREVEKSPSNRIAYVI